MNYKYSYKIESFNKSGVLLSYCFETGKKSSLDFAKSLFSKDNVSYVVVSVSSRDSVCYKIMKEFKKCN